eukprot:1178011-Prorocentrum_minimum.AAC.2
MIGNSHFIYLARAQVGELVELGDGVRARLAQDEDDGRLAVRDLVQLGKVQAGRVGHVQVQVRLHNIHPVGGKGSVDGKVGQYENVVRGQLRLGLPPI